MAGLLLSWFIYKLLRAKGIHTFGWCRGTNLRWEQRYYLWRCQTTEPLACSELYSRYGNLPDMVLLFATANVLLLVLLSMKVSKQSNAALKSMGQWFTQRVVAWCRGRVCNFARRRHLEPVGFLSFAIVVQTVSVHNRNLQLFIRRYWSKHGALGAI